MSLQNSHQISDVKVMLKQGKDGNGIESIEKTGTSGNVDTYTITFTDGTKTTYTVTNGESGGIYPHIIVISESGSTVTLTKGSTVITASETSTGHFEADVTEFGTWTIDAILGGDDAQVSLYVDTVKIYTVDDSHFHSDITVEYPSGATCNLAGQGESYYATGSPYTFTVHHTGSYTITVVYDGQTYTETVTVSTTGEIISKVVPSPSSAPANDINFWLFFGDVSGTFSSLADILANSTALATLMASTDAVDYLVRCKDWINKALVPTMTSNTTPSGECIASGIYSAGFEAYKAFDGNDSTKWCAEGTTNKWVGYVFPNATKVGKVFLQNPTDSYSPQGVKTFKIQYSDNGTDWTDATDTKTIAQAGNLTVDIEHNNAHRYWRMLELTMYSANNYATLSTLQFYPVTEGIPENQSAMSYIGLNNYCANTLLADADWCDGIANSEYIDSVLNVKVPTMTSNTAPSGIVSGDATFRSGNEGYKAFDNNDTTYAFSSVSSTEQSTFYCEYDFPSNLNAYVLNYTFGSPSSSAGKYNVNLQYYDGEEWIDELTDLNVPASGAYSETRNINIKNCSKFRIYGNRVTGSGSSTKLSPIMYTIQIYGREDV